MEFEELGLLACEGLEASAMAYGGLLDDADVLLGVCCDCFADLGDLLWRELQRPVERAATSISTPSALLIQLQSLGHLHGRLVLGCSRRHHSGRDKYAHCGAIRHRCGRGTPGRKIGQS